VKTLKPFEMITDFVTGIRVPNIGAEENRQKVERFLVDTKGYDRDDIEVDVPIEIEIGGEPYRSRIDLVAGVDGKRFMVIKCAAGSLGSREREALSAARLINPCPLLRAVVSDGKTALVMDAISGKNIDDGMEAIPSKEAAKTVLNAAGSKPLTKQHLEREKLIFRTYDMMNVNVSRSIPR